MRSAGQKRKFGKSEKSGTEAPCASLHLKDLEIQGAEATLPARLYVNGAGADDHDTLLIFFHGGGFLEGSIDDADRMLGSLVRSDGRLAALSASYTLASVKPFPAAVEDAYAILLWARPNKAKLAWNGKFLVVAGIEAGANLAAVVPHMSRDRGGPNIAGQVLIMPMLDAGLTTCSMRERPLCRTSTTLMDKLAGSCAAGYRAYLPHVVDRIHPYASPLQSSRLKGLPSALILTAENDPLRDEGKQYAEKLHKYGVSSALIHLPVSYLEHHGERNDNACTLAIDHIGAFLRAVGSSV